MNVVNVVKRTNLSIRLITLTRVLIEARKSKLKQVTNLLYPASDSVQLKLVEDYSLFCFSFTLVKPVYGYFLLLQASALALETPKQK